MAQHGWTQGHYFNRIREIVYIPTYTISQEYSYTIIFIISRIEYDTGKFLGKTVTEKTLIFECLSLINQVGNFLVKR